MHIFFSGIGGVGLGPLAEIAHDAGYIVSGSDITASPMTEQLSERGISVNIGQDGSQITATHTSKPIDWLVYSSAITKDHPELVFARSHGIKVTKRDELLAEIIRQRNLKLIAVAGTHGKTTTTGMLIWAFRYLSKPLSYSVGTTLSFAPSGLYEKTSEYFVYECDEYDRNFLSFSPFFSLITALDYDHPDTYATAHDYMAAFATFISHSDHTIIWQKDRAKIEAGDKTMDQEVIDPTVTDLSVFTLAGQHVRENAFLVLKTLEKLLPEVDRQEMIKAINAFPGTGRRFEKLADNLYSDYAHHPTEIAATLELAGELSDHIIAVYQPHQNIRQHELRQDYKDCLARAEQTYWLPTYLSREDPSLPVLTPNELVAQLENTPNVHVAELNDDLWQTIQDTRAAGKLIIVMGAGDIDTWVRQKLAATK